jgi:uncharacterized cupin superfamily protein
MKLLTLSLNEIIHNELRSARTDEPYSRSAVVSDQLGLATIFAHHDILAPGRRASGAHTHSHSEELVVVLLGNPTAYLGEERKELKAGDVVAFTPDPTGMECTPKTGEFFLRVS